MPFAYRTIFRASAAFVSLVGKGEMRLNVYKATYARISAVRVQIGKRRRVSCTSRRSLLPCENLAQLDKAAIQNVDLCYAPPVIDLMEEQKTVR